MDDLDVEIDREWAAMNGVQERFEPVPEPEPSLAGLHAEPQSSTVVVVRVASTAPQVWLDLQEGVATRLEQQAQPNPRWWHRRRPAGY